MNINVKKINKIYSDGRHNAFTSICRFQNKTYVAFRNAKNHLAYDGKIILLSSGDEVNWEKVAVLNGKQDLRDPHLVVFNHKLLLYTGERIDNKDKYFDLVSHCYESCNGQDFQINEVKGLKTNTFLWNFLCIDGKLYASGHISDESNNKCFFYRSTDGLHWELLKGLPAGNETALTFDKARKKLIALVRNEYEPYHPTLCTSELDKVDFFKFPPRSLPVNLQGMMIHKVKDGCIIVARNWDEADRRHSTRTKIYWLDENAGISELYTLPSGGDCSYASWLDKADNKALLSYYSAHNHLQNIDNISACIEHNTGADIFLAEIAMVHK